MNFFKKTLAFLLLALLAFSSLPLCIAAGEGEIGTKDNPENANDRYFSAAKCYLLNTDLEAGDSEGYWYTFTAPSAGYACIDATARDANGAETEAFQVTVECKGETYYSSDEVFTRPVVPFRVSKNDVMTVHMRAKPDKNGAYPKLKIYCNITTTYGNDSDPILIKSDNGFVANVQAQKQVVYQDGTNGGIWGGCGIRVSCEKKADLFKSEVTVGGVVYTDLDKDGFIELNLPGDPNAQIAVHAIFSIYNGSRSDVSYTIRVVDSASEGAPVEHNCSFSFSKTVKAPSVFEEGEDLYVCSGCGEEKIVKIPALERWRKGDVNNDGAVSSVDSNLVKRFIAGYPVTSQALDAADINEDGKLNSNDSFLLRMLILN